MLNGFQLFCSRGADGEMLLTPRPASGVPSAHQNLRWHGWARDEDGYGYFEPAGSVVPSTAYKYRGIAFTQDGAMYVTDTATDSSTLKVAGIAIRPDGALHVNSSAVATVPFAGLSRDTQNRVYTGGAAFHLAFADKGAGEVDLVPTLGNVSATFTRATTATTVNSSGLIVSVSSGVARSYYDPTSLSYLGYLAEGARTNLILRSADTTNASWSKTDTTPTLSGTGPDGATNTANLLTEGTAGTAALTQSVTGTADANFAVSRWFKAGNAQWTRFAVFNGANSFRTWVDTTNGVLASSGATGTGALVSASIKAYPSGWYRVELVGSVGSGATAISVQTSSASASGSSTRVNNSTRLEWGVQFENNVSFCSSYIPTAGASVTRNADVLTYPLTGWYNTATGAILVDHAVTQISTTPVSVSINDGSANNRIDTYNARAFVVIAGGVSQANIGNASGAATVKVASSYGTNDFASAYGGGNLTTDTSGTVPSGLTTLNIGSSAAGANALFGTISSTTYFDTRRQDPRLTSLTSG